MAYKHISRRIKLAFIMFGVTLTLILGLGLISAQNSTESRVIDDTLRAELAFFRRSTSIANAPESFITRTTAIYVVLLHDKGTAPEYLTDLPHGAHDVSVDTHNYRVLVTGGDDVRYIVQYDDTDIRNRERQFVKLVVVFSITTLLASLMIGWLFARRVSAPLTRLANDVVRFEHDPARSIDATSYEYDEIGFLARRIRKYHEQLIQAESRE